MGVDSNCTQLQLFKGKIGWLRVRFRLPHWPETTTTTALKLTEAKRRCWAVDHRRLRRRCRVVVAVENKANEPNFLCPIKMNFEATSVDQITPLIMEMGTGRIKKCFLRNFRMKKKYKSGEESIFYFVETRINITADERKCFSLKTKMAGSHLG